MVLGFIALGAVAAVEYSRHKRGWGLKYPRRGRIGTYYYEFHRVNSKQSMMEVQDALDKVFPQIIHSLLFALDKGPQVYFADVFVNGEWQGTIRVSRTRRAKDTGDAPHDRYFYSTSTRKVTVDRRSQGSLGPGPGPVEDPGDIPFDPPAYKRRDQPPQYAA